MSPPSRSIKAVARLPIVRHLANGGMAIATHIDLGLEAQILDVTPSCRARAVERDEAFL